VLTALFALGLGLLLARLALPLFESWMDRDLGSFAFSAPALLTLVGVAVVVGLVAGAYPAFVLTAMQPARVLKGQEVLPAGRVRLRSVLVVGQYAAALVLVMGSLVIYRQLDFVQSRPLGFDRAHVVTMNLRDLDRARDLPAFKAEIARLPGVAGVTASTHLPTNVGSSRTLEVWEGHPEGSGEEIQIYQADVDADFFDVYDMRVVAGRAFSPDFPSDTAGAVVLNETAARTLGWTPETALGRTLTVDDEPVPVVGVVADFHMHAMHQPIAPLLMQPASTWLNDLSIRVRPESLPQVLAAAERSWATFSDYPFAYAFLDESFAQLYEADRKLGEGVLTFTVVALFIACLGLFGLAAYTAERRTKEVGIRKALGASVGSLVGLLSKDFLRLVVVSLVVATPLAYYAMSRWLEAFAYRIALGPGLFVTAGVLAVVIALLAVSGQALRSASTDPVKALRYE
jgi:putative ABC transport system permease protein